MKASRVKLAALLAAAFAVVAAAGCTTTNTNPYANYGGPRGGGWENFRA
jgi:hypothetical protein